MKKKAWRGFSCALVALIAVQALPAQNWSVTASAPNPITISGQSGTYSNSVTVPAGPVAAGTFASFSGSASCSATWAEVSQATPIGFELVSYAHASVPGPGYISASATSDVTLDFLVTAPAPVSGFFRFEVVYNSGLHGWMKNWEVDVFADGVPELTLNDEEAIVGLVIPPAGVVVRVRARAGVFLFGALQGSHTTTTVRGEFFPSTTFVDRYEEMPAAWPPLPQLHPVPYGFDRWGLEPWSLNTIPLAMVFGFQPTNVPILPGLIQLVTADVVLPAPTGTMIFDLPPMPPGFALYAQYVGVAGDGSLKGSNSVRALWY